MKDQLGWGGESTFKDNLKMGSFKGQIDTYCNANSQESINLTPADVPHVIRNWQLKIPFMLPWKIISQYFLSLSIIYI